MITKVRKLSIQEVNHNSTKKWWFLLDDKPLHTPRKINMEPENHLFEKEIIFQTFIFRFHVSFRGCTYPYFKNGRTRKPTSKKTVETQGTVETQLLPVSIPEQRETNPNDMWIIYRLVYRDPYNGLLIIFPI